MDAETLNLQNKEIVRTNFLGKILSDFSSLKVLDLSNNNLGFKGI